MKSFIKPISYLFIFLSITLIIENTSIFEQDAYQVTKAFQSNYANKINRLGRSLKSFVDKNKDLGTGEIFHENKLGVDNIDNSKGIAYFIFEIVKG